MSKIVPFTLSMFDTVKTPRKVNQGQLFRAVYNNKDILTHYLTLSFLQNKRKMFNDGLTRLSFNIEDILEEKFVYFAYHLKDQPSYGREVIEQVGKKKMRLYATVLYQNFLASPFIIHLPECGYPNVSLDPETAPSFESGALSAAIVLDWWNPNNRTVLQLACVDSLVDFSNLYRMSVTHMQHKVFKAFAEKYLGYDIDYTLLAIERETMDFQTFTVDKWTQ